MDVEEIVKSFEQAPPRKFCFKQDSPEEGSGFHPLDFMGELASCGGILLVILLTFGAVSGAIWLPVIYACILVSLAVLLGLNDFVAAKDHKRLARYGIVAVGKVICRTDVQEHDGTPGIAIRVTIQYTFQTRSGEQVTETRNTLSGWYNQLVQDGPVGVVYLPDKPRIHEPYNSLRYRICT